MPAAALLIQPDRFHPVSVLDAHFHALGRDPPQALIQVKLFPPGGPQFTRADKRKQQQANGQLCDRVASELIQLAQKLGQVLCAQAGIVRPYWRLQCALEIRSWVSLSPATEPVRSIN